MREAGITTAPASSAWRDPTTAKTQLSTVRHGYPAIRATAFSPTAVLPRTDASARDRCTYTLVRVAIRATRTLHHETAPPELLGGAVRGTGAALVAAGGGERRHRDAGGGVPREATVPQTGTASTPALITAKTRPRSRLT